MSTATESYRLNFRRDPETPGAALPEAEAGDVFLLSQTPTSPSVPGREEMRAATSCWSLEPRVNLTKESLNRQGKQTPGGQGVGVT